MTSSNLSLPRRTRGRMSAAAVAKYQDQLQAFCDGIRQIAATLDFEVSARGWCYVLEEHGLEKGDFDAAQTLIADCRKGGLLPLDIVAEDAGRAFENVEYIDPHGPTKEAANILERLKSEHGSYYPISLWDNQTTYVEMLVEKVDLRNLFAPVCAEYNIPIANVRGWGDINTRAALMRRFRHWEARGKQCVVLYCGDHDPAGLAISEFLRSNLGELAVAIGWSPRNLVIDRFGLNADFVEALRLTWIDNLQTGSGRSLDDPAHPHHARERVQDYIRQYGARKCEANALVVRPDAGRAICRQAIETYVDLTAVEQYWIDLEAKQSEVAGLVREMLASGAW